MVARPEADFDARASFARARVENVLRRHRPALLGVARRWTGTADEAEDALQRALEIYVRRLSTVDAATELAWMKVVVRHEAMAVARARPAGASLDDDELGARLPALGPGVDERIERDERKARSLEALAQLRPDERTALLLRAQGFSYREISEHKSWTYTKVNRAVTEGRQRFLSIFARIESGEECERFAPTLLALVQGEAPASDVVALRPHLRHCSRCRATVRELHTSMRHRLALRIPLVAGVAPARWLGERLAGEPVDAVERGSSIRHAIQGLAGRFTSPDVATTVQLGSSGGGRGPAVAALLSLCLGGGAGTYCVATGALLDPTRLVRHADPDHTPRAKPAVKRGKGEPDATATPAATVVARRPAPVEPHATARSDQAAGPAAKHERNRHRSNPAPEFGFEGTTGTPGAAPHADPPSATTAATTPPPAPGGGSTPSSSSPATSGGEFLP